jgi:branched-chain amino acid transport system ATP-binding protein
MAQLETHGVSKHFGGLAAVDQLDMQVEKGEIRGLIGPNGAGKTTLFNTISGMYAPTAGQVFFEGESIGGVTPNKIARRGLVRTFQRDALFHEFDVLHNVTIARHLHVREGPLRSIFGRAAQYRREQEKRAREVLDFVGIGHLETENAANLPHGQQRSLGVALALAAEPRFLMLDEPVTGMNPTETEEMTQLIRRIRDEWGITILLVEHNMSTVMGLCEQVTVLDFGQKLTEGPPKQVMEDERVIEAYLGAEDLVT